MSKKIKPELITYKRKYNFEGVFRDLHDDGFMDKEFEVDCNGEVLAYEFAENIKQKYIYLCVELGKYYVFYRA